MSSAIDFAHATDLFERGNIVKSFREFSETK